MLLAFAPRGGADTRSIRSEGITKARRRWQRAQVVVATEPGAIEFTWANRRPGTAGFARWTAALGQRIDEHGLAAVTRDLDNLVAVARQLGVSPVAADVLADPTQPEPARHRAFAHVVSALVAREPTTRR